MRRAGAGPMFCNPKRGNPIIQAALYPAQCTYMLQRRRRLTPVLTCPRDLPPERNGQPRPRQAEERRRKWYLETPGDEIRRLSSRDGHDEREREALYTRPKPLSSARPFQDPEDNFSKRALNSHPLHTPTRILFFENLR